MIDVHLTIINASLERPRRHLWRLGLLVLVVIPFLPEIVIYLAAALAEIMGCQPDQCESVPAWRPRGRC
jgi:hypothetical protein